MVTHFNYWGDPFHHDVLSEAMLVVSTVSDRVEMVGGAGRGWLVKLQGVSTLLLQRYVNFR